MRVKLTKLILAIYGSSAWKYRKHRTHPTRGRWQLGKEWVVILHQRGKETKCHSGVGCIYCERENHRRRIIFLARFHDWISCLHLFQIEEKFVVNWNKTSVANISCYLFPPQIGWQRNIDVKLFFGLICRMYWSPPSPLHFSETAEIYTAPKSMVLQAWTLAANSLTLESTNTEAALEIHCRSSLSALIQITIPGSSPPRISASFASIFQPGVEHRY